MADNFSEGIRLYKSGKYRETLNFFLNLNSEEVNDKNTMAYYIGLSYARLEKYEDALLYLEQVVTNGEDNEKVKQCTLALAVIYSLTDRSKMAEFEISKLEKMGVATNQVLCTKGYIAWYRNEIDKAISCYEQVLNRDPENATAMNGLGYILAETGRDLTRALFLCKKALDSSPNSPAYLDSLGWVYFNLGLYKEAKSFTKRALEKLPNNEEIKEHFDLINGAEV